MSRNVWGVYGVTTRQLSVGLSAVSGLTAAPGVIGRQLRHQSGGTLFLGGFGGASLPAGASLFAQILTGGVVVPAAATNPVEIDGPASIGLVAAGATVVVNVLELLGDGFAGQY